ncbi:YecA family protein [Lysobacteraceae bacterium NML91-0213]|nr:YecA family protein [Xanthomonadaceae bacterium NML91-0213]
MRALAAAHGCQWRGQALDWCALRNRTAAVSEHELPAAADIGRSIHRLGLTASVSELHGIVAGWMAGGGDGNPGWLGRALADPELGGDEALDSLRAATSAQLEDRDFGFELLLPEPSASLYERSGALFEWCRGFLGAFGLAAGEAAGLSEEGREALGDLARLAAAAPQEAGDDEEESALAELEEFVRVAVLLLHGDCALGPRHRQRLN